MSKSLEKILTQRKNQLLEFSNANGEDSQMDNLQKEVDDIQDAIFGAISARDSWYNGMVDRCRLAQEDAFKSLRQATFNTFYNDCVKPSDNPCLTKNETFYKDRYQRRLGECRDKYATYLTKVSAVTSLESDLQDAKDRLSAYQKSINEAVQSGLSVTEAQAQANIELAKILAEQEAAKLASAELEASLNNQKKYSPYTPLFILGGFGLAALTAFIILRKSKKK